MRKAFIVAGKRTPIGTFMGNLSTVKATELGSIAARATLDQVGLEGKEVDEIILGNVISAGLGQNPARQVSIGAKIPINVPNLLVNKVCASGLKTVQLGAMSIQFGQSNTVLVGGFENMSMAPFYVEKYRSGHQFGHTKLLDAVAHDGLTDAYDGCAMGVCAEKTAKDFNITRELQDAYAITSYERAIKAAETGKFANEITPVKVNKKPDVVIDEEPTKFRRDKIPSLKPVFAKDGTVTAANASKLNDGACTLLLMSEEGLKKYGITPLAEVVSWGDAEVHPMDFNICPADAANVALKKAGLKVSDIDFFEFNEAFSVTGLANMKIMDLDPAKVNVNGGAVALGHPIGMSGARIVLSLISVLEQNQGKYGLASICNGGGGSSALIIKRVEKLREKL